MMFDVLVFAAYMCLIKILSTYPEIRGAETVEPEKEPVEDLNDFTRSPEELADLGNRYLKLENPKLALQFYDKAIERSSSSFNISHLKMRAECHIRLKNWDAAIADYQKIMELKPDDEIGRKGLRRVTLSQKCSKFVNDSSPSVLTENELLTLGLQCFDVNAIMEASHCFTVAIAKNPKFVPPYVQRGLCYSEMRNFGAAESDFRAALKIDPHDRIARRSLSLTLFDTGRFEEAIEEMLSSEDCLATDLEELGNRLMVKADNFVGAFRCYSKALEECHLRRSLHYATKRHSCYLAMKKQKPEKAISDFDKVLKMESRNMIVRLHLTQVLLESGLSREAIEDHTTGGDSESLKILGNYTHKPGSKSLLLAQLSKGVDSTEMQALGLVFMEKKKFKEALLCLTEVIERNSPKQSPFMYVTRGLCHRRLGNLEKAIDDFNVCIKLQPTNWTVQADLCQTLIEIGDLKKAKEVADFAIAKIPTFVDIYSDDFTRLKELREIIKQRTEEGMKKLRVTQNEEISDRT